MSLKKDIISADVQIGSNEAQKSLTDLAQKTAALTNENDRLRISQAKLKALGKESEEEYKKVTAAISANNKTIKENKSQMDALRKTIGVTEMSFPQLRKRAAELRKELLEMGDSADPSQFKKLNSELIATERQMGKLRGRIGETKGIMGSLKALLPVLSLAAIVATLKSLVSGIISVRKEFEKYEAVLTNTLGSNKAARQEMQMLQKFAAETPFALTELTGSFVKLTNYGLKPSREELRKYGDLASSVGKGIDQFTEAMADAVTGEFERLKEFGIKAKKEGDKITFTFKEQSTVVDNNATSIKNYIAGLGDLQGVSGSMAAIAGTLGGKISNMGDAWDGLMNTMGGKSSGVLVNVITWMTSFVNMLDNAFKSVDQIKQAVRDQSAVESVSKAITEINDNTASFMENGLNQIDAQKKAVDKYLEGMNNAIKEQIASRKEGAYQQRMFLVQERDGVIEHYKKLNEIRKRQEDQNEALQGAKKIEEAKKATEAELKAVNDAIDVAHATEKLRLKQYYADKVQLDKEYKARLLASELAYLQAKSRLETNHAKKIEQQSQIIDKQKEYNEALRNALPELMSNRQGVDSLNKTLLEETKLLDFAAQKQKSGSEALEELYSRTESQRDMILSMSDALSEGIYDLASGGEDAIKQAGKNILLFALDMLKVQTEIAIAGATIQSLAQPDSIATFGASGLIRASILVALIEAAFAGVKGLVNNAFGLNSKQSGGFSSTNGPDDEPDGVYHKNEFIGSAPTVRNPGIRKVYNIIDLAQKQGRAERLNLPAVMASMGMLPAGRQSGGYAAPPPERLAVEGGSSSAVSEDTLKGFTEAINRLLKWDPEVDVVTVKKRLKTLDDIESSRGL